MENILRQISGIESAADLIIKDAEQQKIGLSKEMEHEKREFDAQLSKQTDMQIEKILSEIEKKQNDQLQTIEADTRHAMQALDTYFAANHEKLAESLFERLLND